MLANQARQKNCFLCLSSLFKMLYKGPSILSISKTSIQHILLPYREFSKPPVTRNLLQVFDQHWLNHCQSIFRLSEVFNQVESLQRLAAQNYIDNKMDIDSGNSNQVQVEDYSIWALGKLQILSSIIGVHFYKSQFSGPKGQKILLALLDELQYEI